MMICVANSPSAHAQGWACWAQAADRYHLPVNLLYAVARVESGMNYQAIGPRNADGSVDIGLMQINSGWLPSLSRYGITRRVLLDDPCANLNVGAWILSQSMGRLGSNWRGLGAYNAATDSKRAVYAVRVVAMLRRIEREQATQASGQGVAGLQVAGAAAAGGH